MRVSSFVVPLAVLLVFAFSPAAEAGHLVKQHDGSSHYRLTVPDDWTETSLSGVDVAFVGPQSQGFSANMNVVVVSESAARNDQAWLLQTAQATYPEIIAQFPGATGSQPPRSFATASGRPAANYMIDYEFSGNMLRLSQVLFASDFWDRVYILSFTAHRSAYRSHESTFSTAVDTFTVLDEGAAVSGVAIAAIAGAVVAAAVAITVLLLRRHRKAPGMVPGMPGVPTTPNAPEPPTWPPSPPPGPGP